MLSSKKVRPLECSLRINCQFCFMKHFGCTVVKKEPAIKAVKKPAAKKPAVKKPAAKKPAVKKPAVKKPGAKKPIAKKPAAKKPAAKKPSSATDPTTINPTGLFVNNQNDRSSQFLRFTFRK